MGPTKVDAVCAVTFIAVLAVTASHPGWSWWLAPLTAAPFLLTALWVRLRHHVRDTRPEPGPQVPWAELPDADLRFLADTGQLAEAEAELARRVARPRSRAALDRVAAERALRANPSRLPEGMRVRLPDGTLARVGDEQWRRRAEEREARRAAEAGAQALLEEWQALEDALDGKPRKKTVTYRPAPEALGETTS